jgi:hypothetical protein
MFEVSASLRFPLPFSRVLLRAALFYVSVHCLTVHVSAYMAIFKCVGYFYFPIPEEFCFAGFFLHFLCTWSHSACLPSVFCSCAVFLRLLADKPTRKKQQNPFHTINERLSFL